MENGGAAFYRSRKIGNKDPDVKKKKSHEARGKRSRAVIPECDTFSREGIAV